MRRLRPLALIALSACGGAAPTVTPAAPPTARLRAGTAPYTVIEHRQVVQRFQGQPIVNAWTTTMRVVLSLETDTLGFTLVATVDSVSVTGDAGFSPDVVKATRAARLTGHVSPDGVVQGIGPAETPGNPLLDQIMLRLQDFLPRLPPGGARADTAWTDSATFTGRSADVPLTISATTTHQTGTWKEWQNARVLELADTMRYSLTGEGTRAGQPLVLSGSGRAYSHRLIAPDGVIVFEAGSDTLELQLELGGTGLVIPMTQTRSDTVFREAR